MESFPTAAHAAQISEDFSLCCCLYAPTSAMPVSTKRTSAVFGELPPQSDWKSFPGLTPVHMKPR